MAELSDFAHLRAKHTPAPPKAPHLKVVGATGDGPDPAEVAAALLALSPTLPEDAWWKLVIAVRAALPGQEGFDLVDRWSSQAREEAGQTTSLRTEPGIWQRAANHTIDHTHLFRAAADAGWKAHRGFNIVGGGDPETRAEAEEAARTARDTAAYPPLAREELPHFLGLAVDHLAPLAVAWESDWSESLLLASLSTIFPLVAFENLGLNLWFLGLAKQELGKSRTLTESRRVTQAVATSVGVALHLVSHATLEGYAKVLKGDRTIVYGEHHEYGSMLQILSREHMAGIKGMLCALYDGEDWVYERSNNTVEFTRPYVAVCAATHQKTLARTLPLEDLSNGYMSRFLLCSPRYRVGAKLGYRGQEERDRLVGALAEHIRPLVHHPLDAGWLIPAHSPFHVPPAIRDYQGALGLTTDDDAAAVYYDMDDALDEEETVSTPGRIYARVLKVATLLELLSADPLVSGGRIHVRDQHAALAVRLVERGASCTRRMAERIGLPEDAQLADRVAKLLKARAKLGRAHSPATAYTERELCQSLKVTKKSLEPAMYLLQQDGALMQYEVGKATRYGWQKGA